MPGNIAAVKKPGYFEVLEKSITSQFNWLAYVTDENGNYPHFNDSTNGIAPSVSHLFKYAAALNPAFLQPVKKVPPRDLVHWQRLFGESTLNVWIDASSVGPAYIPGHAHADDLTFCLSLNGKRIIVDPAISTYEKNERRGWERSTAAHNTVAVAGKNSSAVWGGFRVGKRATTTIELLTEATLIARHNGYSGSHRRKFELTENELTITDDCPHESVARLHFNHDCVVELSDQQVTGPGFKITWSPALHAALSEYRQATGFNQLQTAQVLEITFSGVLVTVFANHFPPVIRY